MIKELEKSDFPQQSFGFSAFSEQFEYFFYRYFLLGFQVNACANYSIAPSAKQFSQLVLAGDVEYQVHDFY
jgi:hypothetical protein